MKKKSKKFGSGIVRKFLGSVTLLGLVLCVGSMLSAGTKGDKAKPSCTAIRGVRVFDGRRVIENTTVLVRGGRIGDMGTAVDVPDDAMVVNGAGRTLLPGLIDSHAHVLGEGPQQALQFGVTTQVDMFTDFHLLQEFKRQQAAGPNPGRADLVSSGTLATVPGGHGSEYGMAIPTLTRPEEAQAFVDARVAEGSDFIKIIYGHGSKSPCLDKSTLAALITAAHNRKKLAAVHVENLQDARDAVECHADILAHAWIDKEPDAAFLKLARGSRVVLIPTLTVIGSVCGLKPGLALINDPQLKPLISPAALPGLQREFPGLAVRQENFDRALQIARTFKKSDLSVLAGTDAPNPGTAYGASLHQELEFLVQAGFTPAEALNAATALPAAVFGLGDRGRIAKGLLADLLLVEGNPLAEIRATRRIAGIWKDGMALETISKITPGKPVEKGNLKIKLNYSGDGKVDESHKIIVFLFVSPDFVKGNVMPIGSQTAAAKDGAVTFSDLTAGNYYTVAVFDKERGYDGQSGPPPSGASMGMYSTAPSAPGAIKVEGGKTAEVDLPFNDSLKMP